LRKTNIFVSIGEKSETNTLFYYFCLNIQVLATLTSFLMFLTAFASKTKVTTTKSVKKAVFLLKVTKNGDS